MIADSSACGYTEPRGSREYFGSLILGLYNKDGKLVHVGQAGTGFTHTSQAALESGQLIVCDITAVFE